MGLKGGGHGSTTPVLSESKRRQAGAPYISTNTLLSVGGSRVAAGGAWH